MTDREKVINGLECCSKGDCADCDNCTYYGMQTNVPCESTLMRDAIALLKAQEPNLVHVTADISRRKIGECPNCGAKMDGEQEAR